MVPKFISKSDPAAQWTGAHKGHAFFAYSDNYLIDLKVAIIVDVEPTRAIRQAEVGATKTMIDRTEACFGLKPQRLTGDTAYGSAEILGWMVEQKKIAPHVAAMRAHLASDLNCEEARISVKATTTERLGFAGREEGIAAIATVLLQMRDRNAGP